MTPASTRVPYSLRATLADLDAPSQPPSSMDGGSGTGEVPSAGVGDVTSVLSPAMQQTAPADSAETLLDPSGTLNQAAADVPILRGDGELVQGDSDAVAGHPPAQQQGPSILPARPGGLRTTAPAASPSAGGARISPAEAAQPVTLLRFSRMAPGLWDRAAGGPGDDNGARARGWGLSRLREPQDGGAGPSFDSGFVLGAEQRRKEPLAREGRQEPLVYITVASVVAVLLAMGGLLFYKYKSRVRPPRQPILPPPRAQASSPASVSPLFSWSVWIEPHFPHHFEIGGWGGK